MIQFCALTEQLRRTTPIMYYSDPSTSVQQLSACLLFKGKLRDSSKELPKTIHELNSTSNHEYSKVVKPDLLKYLTQHMVEDNLKVMLIKKENNLEFPYEVVSKYQSDFEAIIRHFKQQYGIKLLSSINEDVLSVLLGKYNKNIDCETLDKYKQVYISCHAFLILQNDIEIRVDNNRVEWVDLKLMINYDCLRTMRTESSDMINETLRHSSYVSDAAKRKAKNVQFTFLLINQRKLKGIFLQLWLYAVEVMIEGSNSKYHKKILSDYVRKAQQFNISFRWYHPFGFLMKYNAKTNYRKQMKKFSYKEQKSSRLPVYLAAGGITVTLLVLGFLGYRKWRPRQ